MNKIQHRQRIIAAAPAKTRNVVRTINTTHAVKTTFMSDDDDQKEHIFDFNMSAAEQGPERSQFSDNAAKDFSRMRKRITSAASHIGSSHVDLRETLMQQRNALEQERMHTFRTISKALQRAKDMESQFTWSLVNFIIPVADKTEEESAEQAPDTGIIVDAGVNGTGSKKK